MQAFKRRLFQNAMDIDRPITSIARWPRYLAACVLKSQIVVKFKTDDLVMTLKPKITGFGSTSLYIKRDAYEPELLFIKSFISPGDHVIDIGSSYGAFALFMSSYVGEKGKVYAFEPGSYSYSQLKTNIELNRRDARIETYKVAASDRTDTIKLYHIGGAPVTFSNGGEEGVAFEEIPARRIDEVLDDSIHGQISFIKIDVEGYERTALEGARKIIESSRPVIMFEVSADALLRQKMTPEDIYEYIREYGYSFSILNNGRLEAADNGEEGNIFAIQHKDM